MEIFMPQLPPHVINASWLFPSFEDHGSYFVPSPQLSSLFGNHYLPQPIWPEGGDGLSQSGPGVYHCGLLVSLTLLRLCKSSLC